MLKRPSPNHRSTVKASHTLHVPRSYGDNPDVALSLSTTTTIHGIKLAQPSLVDSRVTSSLFLVASHRLVLRARIGSGEIGLVGLAHGSQVSKVTAGT